MYISCFAQRSQSADYQLTVSYTRTILGHHKDGHKEISRGCYAPHLNNYVYVQEEEDDVWHQKEKLFKVHNFRSKFGFTISKICTWMNGWLYVCIYCLHVLLYVCVRVFLCGVN